MKKSVVYLSIIILVILSSLSAYILIPGSSAEIEKTADRFEVEAYWNLTTKNVEPAYRVCLGGNRCPSVRKDWETDQKVTLESFQSMLAKSGWALKIKGTCEPRQNVSGEGPVCSASGRINDFNVQIYLSKDKDLNSSKMQLFVDPSE